MNGTIHTLTDRGFGFIEPDGDVSNCRHFFHCTRLVGVNFDSLQKGERVEFESVRGERGLEARNVTLIEK